MITEVRDDSLHRAKFYLKILRNLQRKQGQSDYRPTDNDLLEVSNLRLEWSRLLKIFLAPTRVIPSGQGGVASEGSDVRVRPRPLQSGLANPSSADCMMNETRIYSCILLMNF